MTAPRIARRSSSRGYVLSRTEDRFLRAGVGMRRPMRLDGLNEVLVDRGWTDCQLRGTCWIRISPVTSLEAVEVEPSARKCGSAGGLEPLATVTNNGTNCRCLAVSPNGENSH